jgi:hypothetical protein
MKALIVFVALVLGYSTVNMFQLKVNASTYKHGVDAYLNKAESVQRGPAIVSNN